VALVILAVWLLDSDDGSPAAASITPTPTPSPTATAEPSPTPEATATPTPTPAPGPTPTATAPPSQAGGFTIAAWDGSAWRSDSPLDGAAYREGQALTVLVQIERARDGAVYPLRIRYDCRAFDFLTSYDATDGDTAALAAGGPGSAIPDAAVRIPDDPGTPADDAAEGSLNLWGGSFSAAGPLLPGGPCAGEKTLEVSVAAASDTLYVLWAARIAGGAAASPTPLRLSVDLPGGERIGLQIAPGSVLAG
jgi:hypothetical protein